MKGTLLLSLLIILGIPACALDSPIPPKGPFVFEPGTLPSGPQENLLILDAPASTPHAQYSQKQTNTQYVSTELFHSYKAHQGLVNALVVSQDGLRAFSGGQDGTVMRSILARSPSNFGGNKAAEEKIRSELLLTGSKPILALSLSPDERYLLISLFSTVLVFDLEKREIVCRLTHVRGRILALAWDPRQELVVLGRANGDVFVWNLSSPLSETLDSAEAVERYEGAFSPIVKLSFHPSGRAFFAAERRGQVAFWRLLRTEEELGLRDYSARIDQKKAGILREIVGSIQSEIHDIWLNADATEVFVAATDGRVHRWKIRGARKQPSISVGDKAVFGVRGISLRQHVQSRRVFSLLGISGREQRLSFFCENSEEYNQPLSSLPVPVHKSVVSEAENSGEEEGMPKEEMPEASRAGFVAQSERFQNPLLILRGGDSSTLLWATQKTGNLVIFNANLLSKTPQWRAQLKLCKE